MNYHGAYMIAKSLYEQGWRELKTDSCAEMMGITEEEAGWVVKQFNDIVRMYEMMNDSEEWWKKIELAYVVFGRPSESIDDALEVYDRLCEDDRRAVIEDALEVTGWEPTGAVSADPEEAERDRLISRFERADNAVSTGTGGELLRQALGQMGSELRNEARCRSCGSIAVLPDCYFVGYATRSSDVIRAALKATTDVARRLTERSNLLRYQGDHALADELLWKREGAYEARRAFFGWISTPCPGDYKGQD